MHSINSLLLLISLYSILACNSSKQLSSSKNQGEKLTYTWLDQGEHSEYLEEETRIINTEKFWDYTWKILNVDPRRPVPAVDFSQNSIAFIAMGEFPTGGHKIRVDSIIQYEKTLVYYSIISPGDGCMATMGMTQPYGAITLKKVANEDVIFKRSYIKVPCKNDNKF